MKIFLDTYSYSNTDSTKHVFDLSKHLMMINKDNLYLHLKAF